uniref:Uncharacterized protein n=1 Tax=Heterorhabditis bacteriophora TaxID=37862 RepID=A0A1I7WJT7_HETBA
MIVFHAHCIQLCRIQLVFN